MDGSLPNTGSDTTRTGIALMLGAMFVVPFMPAIAKLVSGEIPAGEAAMARFAFQTLYLAPFAYASQGSKLFRPDQIWLLFARGGLIAAATLAFFTALAVMPLADTTAIYFIEPFILALISALFMGEIIGWRRAIAIATGFGGAMLVIRPSFAEFGWTALLPVISAFSVATYLTLTRVLSRGISVLVMQFYAGVSGVVVIGIALSIGAMAGAPALALVWPTLAEWALLATLGVIATVSHLLMSAAFTRAPGATLAPFQYLEIIGATLLGLVLFNDFPDTYTWAGLAIIVSSGLYILWRERRRTGGPGS